jgi:hypothetical protein
MSKATPSVRKPLFGEPKKKWKGYLILDRLPSEVKERFKAACALRGKTMRDTLIYYMERHATETEKQYGGKLS